MSIQHANSNGKIVEERYLNSIDLFWENFENWVYKWILYSVTSTKMPWLVAK